MPRAIFEKRCHEVYEVNSNLKQQYRILLVNKPRLLREIFRRAFQRYPDVVIVGEETNSSNLNQIIDQLEANWVILSLGPNGEFPESANALTDDHPEIGILGISADGSHAKAICGENYNDDLTSMTLNELMDLIRTHLDLDK